MPPKDIPITFRCDGDFRDRLYSQACAQDMPVSGFIRAAILPAAPQIRAIRGLGRAQLEDIREPRAARQDFRKADAD